MNKSDRKFRALEIAPGEEPREIAISLNEIRSRGSHGEPLASPAHDIYAVHAQTSRGLAPCLDIELKSSGLATLHGTVVFVKLDGIEMVNMRDLDIADALQAAKPWTNQEIEESRWWKR